MKTLKRIHILIFLGSAIAAVYTPALVNIEKIGLGETGLHSLRNFAGLIIFSIAILWVYLTFFGENKIPHKISKALDSRIMRGSLIILYFLFAAFCLFIILKPVLINYSPLLKFWVALCFSIIGSMILDLAKLKLSPFYYPIFSIAAFTLIAYLLGDYLNVTSYPLALTWSETVDYNFGYSYYAQFTDAEPILLPFYSFSRYLMLAVPWFISDSEIIIHRLWETILITLTPLAASFLLIRRMKFSKPLNIMLFIWAALFILQAPIYYNLLIIPILLFPLFRSDSRSKYLLIFLVSIWAGFSKVNWMPMPAAIGILLYLYDTFDKPNGQIKSTFWNSFLIGAPGLAGGGIGYLFANIISNQESSVVNAAFAHGQIWQRLLPSPANGIGLLLWIFIVSLPALLLVALSFPKLKTIDQRFRYLIITGLLGVFFLGGTFVSVKIGAGSDIHNYDGFVLLLLIVCVYELKQRLLFSISDFRKSVHFAILFSLLFLLPGLFVLQRTSSIRVYDSAAANETIREIQEIIDTTNQDGGEVLLADQQHLILFGKVDGVEFYSHFDKAVMFEVIMAKDTDYINKHYMTSLSEHRYDVVIVEPQRKRYKDPATNMFAEENNLYFDLFYQEFRTYYKLDSTLNDEKLEIYVPKGNN